MTQEERFELHIRGLTKMQKDALLLGRVMTGAFSLNDFLLQIVGNAAKPYIKKLEQVINEGVEDGSES